MKKFFVLLICSILAINCTAISGTEPTYEYIIDDTHITIEFDSDSVFSAEQQQLIADRMVYGDDGASTYAWCWLTGHDIVTDGVSLIEHKVYTSSPRCIRRTYSVETCTKCDHYEQTLISTVLIVCCPEE